MAVNEPHGGALVDRWLLGPAATAARERARGLRRLHLGRRELSDLELIATGAFSPLHGFLGQLDYRRVLREMRLQNGAIWPLPITLAAGRETAAPLALDSEVALTAPDGRLVGLLELAEKFEYDRELEAQSVYGTTDPTHPGVRGLLQQGEVYLGGAVWLFERPAPEFPTFHLDPADTRRLFAERGWRRVVGFQTRNPVHRAHEYIQKCALETVDGLLLHPLVGETKADDLPAEVRMRAYQTLLEGYYPEGRTLLSVFPAAMRYAGPREAVFHALCRKNYGCTHFIVGRDHAGVGGFYGPYDAQRFCERLSPAELGITPVCFEHTFFCRRCDGMASAKTCPHGAEHHVALSGTRLREMLAAGVEPPPEFTRPEVARVLIEGLRRAAVS